MESTSPCRNDSEASKVSRFLNITRLKINKNFKISEGNEEVSSFLAHHRAARPSRRPPAVADDATFT